MNITPEYRKSLRERLLGKGSKLIPKSEDQNAVVESTPEPLNFWGGSTPVKRNLSNNLMESPFDWSWGTKAGNKDIALVEDKPAGIIKEEKEAKPVDSFSKPKFKVI